MIYQQGSQLLSIGQASALLRCSIQTLRNWHGSGKLVPIVLPSGTRRYEERAIRALIENGEEQVKENNRVVIVSRVSSLKQESKDGSLTSQTEELKQVSLVEYGCGNPLILSQVASGQNLDRRQLIQLIELSFSGQLKGATVLVTYRDRLGRSCVSLIKRIIELGGATLRVVHPDESKEELSELLDDIKSLFCLYNARTLGKRGGRKNIRELDPKAIEAIMNLHKAGVPEREIAERLRGKYQDKNGKVIGKWTIKKVLSNRELKDIFGENDNNSFELFKPELLKMLSDGQIHLMEVRNSYIRFCRKNHLYCLSPKIIPL